MANNNQDYGYFGKGDMGYAQYMTAFNRNHGGAAAGAATTAAVGRDFSTPALLWLWCSG